MITDHRVFQIRKTFDLFSRRSRTPYCSWTWRSTTWCSHGEPSLPHLLNCLSRRYCCFCCNREKWWRLRRLHDNACIFYWMNSWRTVECLQHLGLVVWLKAGELRTRPYSSTSQTHLHLQDPRCSTLDRTVIASPWARCFQSLDHRQVNLLGPQSTQCAKVFAGSSPLWMCVRELIWNKK